MLFGQGYERLMFNVRTANWRDETHRCRHSLSYGALRLVRSGLKIGSVSRPSSNGRIVFLSGVDSFLMMFVCWSYLRVGIYPRLFVLAAPVLGYSKPGSMGPRARLSTLARLKRRLRGRRGKEVHRYRVTSIGAPELQNETKATHNP